MAKAYLFLSPFGAALAYGLAALQGADHAHLPHHRGGGPRALPSTVPAPFLRGARAADDMGWINVILKLLRDASPGHRFLISRRILCG